MRVGCVLCHGFLATLFVGLLMMSLEVVGDDYRGAR
jgi:hypothetical protein